MFLVKHNIPVLEHPPYSPDLAPCDFYLFPKVKSALKGTRFESFEAVKEKSARIMKELTKEQWKIRMERYRDRAGVYFYKTTLHEQYTIVMKVSLS
jgi:histone-lysine N-methyltransferase SETMAR